MYSGFQFLLTAIAAYAAAVVINHFWKKKGQEGGKRPVISDRDNIRAIIGLHCECENEGIDPRMDLIEVNIRVTEAEVYSNGKTKDGRIVIFRQER